MPEIISTEPQYIGTGQVFITGSRSRPGVIHVTLHNNDGWVCNCEGWRYTAHCWHIERLVEQFGDADDLQIMMGE
jgi:hypothetical protein